MVRRIDFAHKYINRDNDFWNKVIFRDKKVFHPANNARLKVYRPRNQRFEQNYLHKHQQSGRFSVHVFAWFSSDGPGALNIIDGRLTDEKFVDVLKDAMLPSAREGFLDNDFVFQQDNPPVHTARVVRARMENNCSSVTLWKPEYEPNREHLRLYGKQIYRDNYRPRNCDELIQAIRKELATLTRLYTRSLAGSMKRRLTTLQKQN